MAGRAGDMGQHPDGFRAFLRELPDEIARLEEQRGRPLVVELPAEPLEYQRRLLETLGVRWEVRPVTVEAAVKFEPCAKCPHIRACTLGGSCWKQQADAEKAQRPLLVSEMEARHQERMDAQPLTTRCGVDGCGWTFEGPAGEGRERAKQHRADVHPELANGRRSRTKAEAREAGVAAAYERAAQATRREQERAAAALERMDAGEPQQVAGGVGPETTGSETEGDGSAASSSSPRVKWTRESIVAAIQEYAREHGEPPTSTVPGFRSPAVACRRLGWSWAAAVEAAGFPRPTKGTRRGRPLDAGEPSEPKTPAGDTAADASVGGASSPASSEPGVGDSAVTGSAPDLPRDAEVVGPPDVGTTRAPGRSPTQPGGASRLSPRLRSALIELLDALSDHLKDARDA